MLTSEALISAGAGFPFDTGGAGSIVAIGNSSVNQPSSMRPSVSGAPWMNYMKSALVKVVKVKKEEKEGNVQIQPGIAP
jgi:hypothetical protein